MSPSPGRITRTFEDVPFSRRFLGHGDARKVKSEPDFIAMREEVLALIHGRVSAPDVTAMPTTVHDPEGTHG